MEEGAPAGEVDSDDDFEADMALELKERVQVKRLKTTNRVRW